MAFHCDFSEKRIGLQFMDGKDGGIAEELHCAQHN